MIGEVGIRCWVASWSCLRAASTILHNKPEPGVSRLDPFDAYIRKTEREEDNNINSVNEKVKSIFLLGCLSLARGLAFILRRWVEQIGLRQVLLYL